MNPLSTLRTVASVIGIASKAVGWVNFGSLSPHHFVEIQEEDEGDLVIGRLVSYSLSSESNWENTFEGMDEDSKNPFLSGIIQSGDFASTVGWERLAELKGKTLITEAQSQQVWRGIQPQSISLEVEFKAFNDAYQEVELPIQYLTRMQSPRLSMSKPESVKEVLDMSLEIKNAKNEAERSKILEQLDGVLGDVPKFVTVNFLSKRFETMYVIESISEDVDAVRVDAQGNRVRQTVNITLGSLKGVTRDRVKINNARSIFKQITTIRNDLANTVA